MDTLTPYLPMIFIGIAVAVGLIIVLLVFKTMKRRVRGRKGQRIGITEYHEIDEQRRLVLVRRDEVEHLILIGGPQDVVVESGITLNQFSRAAEAHSAPLPPSPPPTPLRTAPRAPVFAERRPVLRPVEPTLGSKPEPLE